MYYPGCEVYEETREPEEKKPMSFCDWMKNMSADKKAELDAIAYEAEMQREIDEEAAWEEACKEDRTGWEYEFYTEFDK